MIISLWTPEHPRWLALLACVEAEGQTDWLDASYDFHLSSHVLVATDDSAVMGFLRFVIQYMGPPDDCPVLMQAGNPLTEAKILAFGVPERFRRQGVGTELQRQSIVYARELGCYQLRSYSELSHAENYALKLKLGFAAFPEQRANGQQGVYFVMPLASHKGL